MYNNKMERLKIVLEIVNKLKNYKCPNGTIINLYNENLCYFIKELKEIFNKYIKQDEDNVVDYKGVLYFQEINKNIEYFLPCKKNVESLFVIKSNTQGL
uniref:Uncharacterized protein n=1 Tax=viral metagenome TaxID=1070528 RepID=A0A6C0H6G0_9ZZZZ